MDWGQGLCGGRAETVQDETTGLVGSFNASWQSEKASEQPRAMSFLFQHQLQVWPFKKNDNFIMFIPSLILFLPSKLQSKAQMSYLRESRWWKLLSDPQTDVCPLWTAKGQASWSEYSEVCPWTPDPEVWNR